VVTVSVVRCGTGQVCCRIPPVLGVVFADPLVP
jgi:hypothetical protein